MKSMFLRIIMMTALMIVISCREEPLDDNSLTYSDFQRFLKPDMTYTEITDLFGKPVTDIGSGIHIYVYELLDSTEMWIGYTDRIHYARHMSQDHQLIENLI